MRIVSIAQTFLLVVLMVLVVGPAAYSKDKPKSDDKPDSAAATTKIVETLVVDWPEKDNWTAGYFHQGEENQTQMYFPEGQSHEGWKEMASVETVPGMTHANVPGLARMTYLGTKKASPNATWDIIKKGNNERGNPFILYQIICPDFVTKEPPQVQLWKITIGKTGLFNLQYSYKGDDMPEERKEQMLKVLDEAYIKRETIEVEP
jgi:hypothetical protein